MQIKNIIFFTLILFCIGLNELQSQTVKDIDGIIIMKLLIKTLMALCINFHITKFEALGNQLSGAFWSNRLDRNSDYKVDPNYSLDQITVGLGGNK